MSPEADSDGRRWPVVVALAAPALFALLGLQAAVDPWLQGPLVAAARGRVALDEVVVLGVDPAQDLHVLRGQHGHALIRQAAPGAKVIVLDLPLTRPGEVDGDLARAIGQVRNTGTRVIVPVASTAATSAAPPPRAWPWRRKGAWGPSTRTG